MENGKKNVRNSLQYNVLVTKPTKLSRNNKAAHPYPCREFTLKESFWFALTSFTPQGGGEAPKSMSGRVLVAAYWLFVVLMLATFTANLAGMATTHNLIFLVESTLRIAPSKCSCLCSFAYNCCHILFEVLLLGDDGTPFSIKSHQF